MPVTFARDCFNPLDPFEPDWDAVWEPENEPGLNTGHYKEGWESDANFRVVAKDVAAAARALLRALERFQKTDIHGKEWPKSPDELSDDFLVGYGRVETAPGTTFIRVDTRNWMTHEMVATMKSILAEELERSGVTCTVYTDRNEYLTERRPWPGS